MSGGATSYLHPWDEARRLVGEHFRVTSSVKLRLGEVDVNRYHLAFDLAGREAMRRRACDLRHRLRMPLGGYATTWSLLGLGLTFGAVGVVGAEDRALYKLYVCRDEVLDRHALSPHATALGGITSVEWNPDRPHFSVKEYSGGETMSNEDLGATSRACLFAGAAGEADATLREELLAACLDVVERSEHPPGAFLVREQATGRASIDLALAPLPVASVMDFVGRVTRLLAAPEPRQRHLEGALADRTLERLSFGSDDGGRPFVTLYYSAEQPDPFLN